MTGQKSSWWVQSHIVGLMLLVVLWVAGGCSRSASSMDARDERDPVYRRAVALKNMGDVDGAIQLFQRALERQPRLARAHFELGLLYDMKKQDYLRALYHYQRYLELRPNVEKREQVEGLIRKARISFALTLPSVPDGAIQEIAMLKKEIALLKSQQASQDKSVRVSPDVDSRAVTTGRAMLAEGVPQPPPPQPVPALPPMQEYVVQRGETLSSIAAKVYRDSSKWRIIYEANRSTLTSPESVKAGQTLLIPRQP